MFKILTSGCEPTRGSEFSACVDLYASEDVTIEAGATKLIGLGVCLDVESLFESIMPLNNPLQPVEKDLLIQRREHFKKSHYLQLMLRSSLGKKGLILPNGVGVIDLDYKDEIKMIIHNPIKNGLGIHVMAKYGMENEQNSVTFFGGDCQIKKGDRIAQITLIEHKSFLFGIDTDATRTGGFGSTN